MSFITIYQDSRNSRISTKEKNIEKDYRIKIDISCSNDYSVLHTEKDAVADGELYTVFLKKWAVDTYGDLYIVLYKVPMYKGHEPEMKQINSLYITNVIHESLKGSAKMNIKNISLTEEGDAKFDLWFDAIAKKNIVKKAVMQEMLGVLEEEAAIGHSLVYELGQSYTNTGRPELFIFAPVDVEIEWIEDAHLDSRIEDSLNLLGEYNYGCEKTTAN